MDWVFSALFSPGADVNNKFFKVGNIALRCWNKAPWLVQNSQRTWNIQSEFMTAAPGIFNFFVSVYFYKTGAKVTTKLSGVTILHWIKALSMDDVISHSTITNQSQCVICTLCWCAITKVVYDSTQFMIYESVILADFNCWLMRSTVRQFYFVSLVILDSNRRSILNDGSRKA